MASMNRNKARPIEIGLNAAVVAIDPPNPLILVTGGDGEDDVPGLPFGPFDPLEHRTFEMGLRAWVEEQTALRLGYVEQLYTFGDRGRHAVPGETGAHVVSVGYLALARLSEEAEAAITEAGGSWHDWYGFFPWEDWRGGRPALLDEALLPCLADWASDLQRERLRLAFGIEGGPWDEERVLDRYELLYEAGLVEEARRDGRATALGRRSPPALGRAMRFDHRRILATAISRLRAKLKYRPVVFELMPDAFTLTELQHAAEAIAGRHLHKQNFRRFLEGTQMVEPTGATARVTGGRPAKLYRFRREVLAERRSAGLRIGGRA